MKKRVLAIGFCGALVLAIGASPRYLEELCIGGGLGDAADGGADFDQAGNIATDGSVTCNGLAVESGELTAGTGEFSELAARQILEAGEEDTTAGALHVYGGSGSDSGALYFYTPADYDGTVDYWQLNSGLLGVLQLSGFGGTCDPGMILQFSAPAGQFSLGYDAAVWGGEVEVGRDGVDAVQGTVTVYDNGIGTGPGCIKLYSCDGTAKYVFAANDGSGLRISATAPAGNTSGNWLVSDKFRRADSSTDAVDLGTSEVAGLLAASKVGSGLSDPQINDNLTVWSGSINDTPIGASVPSSARFDELTVMGVTSNSITEWPADTPAPSVADGNVFQIPDTWTAGNYIISLSGGVTGQRILILGGDCDCIIPDTTYFQLSGTWMGCEKDTLELFFDGSAWREISRSNN